MTPLRYCLTIFSLALSLIPALRSQESLPVSGNFPVPYDRTNLGRDFWLAFPVTLDSPGSSTASTRLYITSSVRTEVRIWAGGNIKKIVYTIPNDVVTVDLSLFESQMFTRNEQSPIPGDQIYPRRAVHVQAESPIVVYGVNRTEQTSEGILALPVNALGQEYVIASYTASVIGTVELPSQYMVIAPYDGTTVTITHPHRSRNHQAGETFSVNLDRGDVFSAMTSGFGGDMSGVLIRSTQPVAVTAGVICAMIPVASSLCCCDNLSEMMVPTTAWGKVYHGVPFKNRAKGDFWRIFAREPNTTVYINGTQAAQLSGPGGQDGEGWFEYRAAAGELVEITASKPVQVAQYNPVAGYDNVTSDPFFILLTPQEQYQSLLTFSTPRGDFSQNFLNLVSDSAGLYSMEIAPAGTQEWRKVWTLPTASPARAYKTSIDGKRYFAVSIDIKPGTYHLRSSGTLTGYLYGLSGRETYGYPISLSVRDLTKIDQEPPAIATKTESCNGTVEVVTRDKPEDVSIRSNLAMILLDPDPNGTDNYELMVTQFQAGMSQETSYKLIVSDPSRPAKAVVVISDMAGNVRFDTVRYTPIEVASLLNVEDYGKVRSTETGRRVLTLANESEKAVTIEEVVLQNGGEGFEVVRPRGRVILGPKGSPSGTLEVEIEYTGTIKDQRPAQTYTDRVGIRTDCGPVLYFAQLKGQVVKPMIRVTDHDFGPLPVGVGAPLWQMEVRNISTVEGSTLTVTGISGPKNENVKIFDVKGGNALQLPLSIEPGQSRVLAIDAIAPDAREYRDTIFFTSDAMDVAEGEDYGWLRIEGEAPASVNTPGSGIGSGSAISSAAITPNPVDRDEATLEYTLALPGTVRISLVDQNGRELRDLAKENRQEPGTHSMKLDLSGLAAGLYFVRINAGDEMLVRRVVIVR